MTTSAAVIRPTAELPPQDQPRLVHLWWMILSRHCEERLRSLYRQGAIPASAFLSFGQEAYSAGLGLALQPGDVFAPLIRDCAGRLAFGEPLLEVFRHYLGRSTGLMRGRDGNVHRGDLRLGQLPMLSHLGSMVSVTAGMLLARRLRDGRDGTVGAAVLGDGAMATGAAHEAINLAAVERLPLVISVANNQFSYSTRNDRSFACRNLVDRAIGYGLTGHHLDGSDFDACRTILAAAVARARAGGGPQLVVADLLRRCGHGEHDDGSYMPAELLTRYPDPLVLARNRVQADGQLDAAGLADLDARALAAVEVASRTALHEPPPDPAQADWSVYADPRLNPAEEAG